MYGETAGWVKTIHETHYGELLGIVIVGPQATELINAGVVGITAEATIDTLADSFAAHPTLAEGIKEAALVALGRPIHLPPPRRAKARGAVLSMVTRASRYLMPTLKDDPADAEAASHKLLVRGGFVRQVGAGLYTYLPLGWRVMRRIEAVIREEMEKVGMEVLMPLLNPAELWRETGRLGVDNLFHVDDSSGKEYVLAMTHEECFTFHAAREIRSYRELPQVWFQIQTKERDEPRPKSGILRTREFIMKDSYSFDRDFDALDESYDRHIEVYNRIFERCGLRTWMVESDTGMMGGKSAHEFMVPSTAGEDWLVLCSDCDYAANLEVARSVPRAPEFPEPLPAPREVETPGATTIEALAEQLGVDQAATAKAMPVVADGAVVLALVRGDDRLHELKLRNALRAQVRPATADEIRETFGAEPGSIGPVGVDVRIVADEALRDGQFVAGANKTGFHLRGVEAGRDFAPEFVDIREAAEGDACPKCDRARCGSRRPSRSETSSSWARTSPRRSAPTISTRTVSSIRW